MAYQAKRSQHYTEQLELVDEKGNVRHTLTVDLDPGAVVEKLSRKYVELLRIKEETDQVDTTESEKLVKVYNNLGNAVISLVESIFEEQDTQIILEFYGNHYNEMVVEILPFIVDIVIPGVRKRAQEQREEALGKYNRKQRRTILKKVK